MYNTDGKVHVSERILWEVKSVANNADDYKLSGIKPFDNKYFYEGYKRACKAIYEKLSEPLQGAQ